MQFLGHYFPLVENVPAIANIYNFAAL